MNNDNRADRATITIPLDEHAAYRVALAPLAMIYVVWSNDGLDEDRPCWRRDGVGDPPKDFKDVELYSGRGGRRLLTLSDAANAAKALGMHIHELPREFKDPARNAESSAQIAPPGLPVAKVKDGEEWRAIDRMVWREDGVLELVLAPMAAGATAHVRERYREVITAFLMQIDPSRDLNPEADYTYLFGITAGELFAALRTWPIFADGKPITPELVRMEGVAAASAEADNLRMTDVVTALRSWPIFKDTGIEITPERIELVAESIQDLEQRLASLCDRTKYEIVDGHRFDKMTTAAAKARGLIQAILDTPSAWGSRFSKGQLDEMRNLLGELTTAFADPEPAKAAVPADERKIITEHVNPPIPLRSFDWSAVREGYDPDSNWPVGWGATEEAAIAALREAEDEQTFEAEPPAHQGALL